MHPDFANLSAIQWVLLAFMFAAGLPVFLVLGEMAERLGRWMAGNKD